MFNEPVLTRSGLTLYAAQHYNNPQCFDDQEFFDDLKKIENLKKLFKRLQNAKNGNAENLARLIVNNIIVLNNLFGPHHSVRIFALELREYLSEIKTVCLFLNIWPEKIVNIEQEGVIETVNIPLNTYLIEFLRKI